MYVIHYSIDDDPIEYCTDTREDFDRKLNHLLEEGHTVEVYYLSND